MCSPAPHMQTSLLLVAQLNQAEEELSIALQTVNSPLLSSLLVLDTSFGIVFPSAHTGAGSKSKGSLCHGVSLVL